jgi:transposase
MKKFAAKPFRVNAEVLGLDVHKDVIVCSRLNRKGEEIATPHCGATPPELEALLDQEVGRKATHVAFEASGSTWWVFDLLVARYGGERVHVAQPKRIAAIANSKQKNDANDAFWLAYLTQEGRLPEAHVPVGQLRELRLATRERQEAVRQRSRTMVRIRSLLRQLGQKMPTRRGDTHAAWAWLRELATQTPGVVGMALLELASKWEFLEQSVTRWDERIEALVAEMPEVGSMERSIPGVGKVLAATIVAEAAPLERFQHPKALACFAGLVPSDHSTGGRTSHGAITREGSRYLRWAFTQAVMACVRARTGPGMAVGRWVEKRQRRMGKAKARVAAARKLAEQVWRATHLPKGTFDAAKPFGGLAAAPAHA